MTTGLFYLFRVRSRLSTAGRAALRALTISALLTLSAMALADGAAADNDDQVRFCFNEWRPYAYVGPDGAAGISVDILREAARRAGVAAEFLELPWKRCLEMVRHGDVDAVMDAMQRPEYLQGPVSFSVYSNTFWVHEDSDLTHFDAARLAGRTIGLVAGYKYPQSLEDDIAAAGLRIDYAVDDDTNLRKLAFGRVDLIVADFASTLQIVRDKTLRLRALRPTHSADRLYPSFNRGRATLQRRLDAALAAMVRDGTIDRIYHAHLGVDFDEMTGP